MKDDLMFIKVAKLLAERSHCVRVKVGSVVVIDGRIASSGWNGTAPGMENCDAHFRDEKYKKMSAAEFRDVHAEFSKFEEHSEKNAILWAARKGIAIEGGTLYCTYSPCLNCAKAIVMSGLKRVVYSELYDRGGEESLKFLRACKVAVDRVML